MPHRHHHHNHLQPHPLLPQAYARYKEKRKKLRYGNKIRYQTRKALADQRPRIKGQFVRVAREGGWAPCPAARNARCHGVCRTKTPACRRRGLGSAKAAMACVP